MKKTDWKYVVGALLFICLVIIAVIGLVMGFVIPWGPRLPDSAKYFLGLHRHQWGNIHLFFSFAFAILIIIHLILSWGWIKGKTHHLFKKRWIFPLAGLAIMPLVILFLIWFSYSRESAGLKELGSGSGRRAEINATKKDLNLSWEELSPTEPHQVKTNGQTTLLDIERASGIPTRKIIKALRLRADMPVNEGAQLPQEKIFFHRPRGEGCCRLPLRRRS